MVGKDGKAEVDKETFIKLSRAMGVNVCLDDACTRFYSSGTDAEVKLANGKVLGVKFVTHSTDSIFNKKDIHMLYFDVYNVL